MSIPADHQACARCARPHPERRGADGLPTRAALDGHAWTPRASHDEPPVTRSFTETLLRPTLAVHEERYTTLFGWWAECTRCGLLTSNTDEGMARHDATHDELDALRAEVERLRRGRTA